MKMIRCTAQAVHRILFGFLNEFFLALGAGDGDFSFALRDPHRLAAAGAVKIAVVPVLEPVQQHQKSAIFLVTLVGVPGEGAEHGPEPEAVGHKSQRQIHYGRSDKQGNHADDHACRQNNRIEFVRSVPPGHKPGQPHPKLCAKLPQPISKSVHSVITLS